MSCPLPPPSWSMHWKSSSSTMPSRDPSASASQTHKLSPTELLVLVQLVGTWWRTDDLPFPSMTTFATRCGVSSRQIQRSVNRLEELNFVQRVKRRDEGHQPPQRRPFGRHTHHRSCRRGGDASTRLAGPTPSSPPGRLHAWRTRPGPRSMTLNTRRGSRNAVAALGKAAHHAHCGTVINSSKWPSGSLK